MAALATAALLLSGAALAADEGYGLRYDARGWLETSESLEAALVRTRLLGLPHPGDAERIEAAVLDALRGQREDGGFGEGAPADRASQTNGRLQTLVDLGVTAERPEMARLLAWIRSLPGDAWSIYFSGSLCRLGLRDFPGLADAVRRLAAEPDEWLAKGCPWTPAMAVESLWFGRGLPGAEVDATLERALEWMSRGMNDAGCLSYWEPWGMVRVTALVRHPLTDAMLAKQLPMILRAQQPDGGWGSHSLDVFRTLQDRGMLDRLSSRPPLPPDWRVVREIPAPAGALWTLAYGVGLLWSRDGETDTVVAVSPADGREARRWKLPEGRTEAIGWGDGELLASQSQPKRVLRLDPGSGALLGAVDVSFAPMPGAVALVAGRVWLSDGWLFPGWSLDLTEPTPLPDGGDPFSLPRLEPELASPLALDFAPTGEGVWVREYWAPILERSDKGQLLEWGELPFGSATAGIAWDGERLWALDGAGRRICAIERARP